MSNVNDAIIRITDYYFNLLKISYRDEEDAMMRYAETRDAVIEQLLPYALEKNYWWEKEDINMAFYQIQNQILVVRAKAFQKYYQKLTGQKYDYSVFSNPEKRAEIIKEARKKMSAKAGR